MLSCLPKPGLTPVEKSFTGVKPARLNRKKTLKKFRAQREIGDRNPFGPPLSLDYFSSFQSISQLNRTRIDDLRVNRRAVGCYVLLRCLDVFMEDWTVKLLVEDHKGDVFVCYVRNYIFLNRDKNVEEEFPFGTVVVVKEPILKRCMGETYVLMVESPADLTKVIWNHKLFQEAVLLGWKDTKCDPETALEWKNTGDELYRAGKYTDAIGAYLMGLGRNPELKVRMMLHLNLTASYQVTRLYESCLSHASLILREFPQNEKALFRAGRSHYELRQYENAKQHFEILLNVNASDLKAMFELQRCTDRLREQDMDFQVYNLRQASTNDSVPIDFGDGVGLVDICPISGKGRGLVAGMDFKPGTVILAEKAVARCWGQEMGEHEDCNNFGLCKVFYRAVDQVYRNPKHFGVLLDLPCRNEQESKLHKLFCDEETQSEPIVDIGRILKVCESNAFGLISSELDFKASLLFLLTSYVNKSCICNSSITVYNDVAVIRTITSVSKGEEITTANDMPASRGYLSSSTRCRCEYCLQEMTVPRSTIIRREQLLSSLERLYFIFCELLPYLRLAARTSMVKAIDALEKTYSGQEKYTPFLVRPYLLIAHYFSDLGELYQDEFMQYVDKALGCLGLSTAVLLRCAQNKYCSLPKDAMLSDRSMLYQICSCVIYGLTSDREVQRWFKVIAMFDRIFKGDESLRKSSFVNFFDPSQLFC